MFDFDEKTLSGSFMSGITVVCLMMFLIGTIATAIKYESPLPFFFGPIIWLGVLLVRYVRPYSSNSDHHRI